MDKKYLFEIIAGRPAIPLLPFDEKNQPRQADDRTIFELPEAAAATGLGEKYLRDLWDGTWSRYLPDVLPGTFDVGEIRAGLAYEESLAKCTIRK